MDCWWCVRAYSDHFAPRLLNALATTRGNLTVIPLEEVIKPEMLRGWIDDSEYMRSVCIVVPK